MAARPPSLAGAQLIDDFGDRIETVNFHAGSEKLPTRMFTALYADVDDHKRLGQQTLGHHPFGEWRVVVMIEVHSRAFSRVLDPGCRCRAWRRRTGMRGRVSLQQ